MVHFNLPVSMVDHKPNLRGCFNTSRMYATASCENSHSGPRCPEAKIINSEAILDPALNELK